MKTPFLQTRLRAIEHPAALDAASAGDDQGLFVVRAHFFPEFCKGSGTEDQMGGIMEFEIHACLLF